MTFKKKLIIATLVLSICSSVLAVGFIGYTVRKQHLSTTREFMRSSVHILNEALTLRKEQLLDTARQFATAGNMGATLKFLVKYGKTSTDKLSMQSTYRQISSDTYRIGLMGKVRDILLYDHEMTRIFNAIQEGNLEVCGASESFSGSWRELIEDLNHLIEAFASPINVTADYIAQLSQHEIPIVVKS